MKFEEIFNEPGQYVSDGFVDGFCFEIKKDGTLISTQYKDEFDMFPKNDYVPVYKGLFNKEYRKVFTRKSLFNKK